MFCTLVPTAEDIASSIILSIWPQEGGTTGERSTETMKKFWQGYRVQVSKNRFAKNGATKFLTHPSNGARDVSGCMGTGD